MEMVHHQLLKQADLLSSSCAHPKVLLIGNQERLLELGHRDPSVALDCAPPGGRREVLVVDHFHNLIYLTGLEPVGQRADSVPELELGEEAGVVDVKFLEPTFWGFARFL